MKTAIMSSIIAAIALLGLQAQAVEGEKTGDRKGFCEEVRQTKHENRKALREFHQKQMEENKAFREGLADAEPDTRIDQILAHRIEQHKENVAIHKRLHQAMIRAVEACEDMPADRKAELLEKLKTRHKEAVAFHKELHKKVVAFLKELEGSDMTHEEKKAAWKDFREEMEGALKKWRATHRPVDGERRENKERRGRPDKQA